MLLVPPASPNLTHPELSQRKNLSLLLPHGREALVPAGFNASAVVIGQKSGLEGEVSVSRMGWDCGWGPERLR